MTEPAALQQEQTLMQTKEQEQRQGVEEVVEQLLIPDYCPILSRETQTLSRCIRERCAWFDMGDGQCCFLSIAYSLRGIKGGGENGG